MISLDAKLHFSGGRRNPLALLSITAKAWLNAIVLRVSQVYGTSRWGKGSGHPG